MSEKYYMLCVGEDGDVFFTEYEGDNLINDIADGYHDHRDFVDSFPDGDLMMWGNKAVIIKGNIVKPFSKEVTVVWGIE